MLEAAALAAPTVDAVRDGKTGWLVGEGEKLADVAERAVKELADPGNKGLP